MQQNSADLRKSAEFAVVFRGNKKTDEKFFDDWAEKALNAICIGVESRETYFVLLSLRACNLS
ncbi:MAG: hypothetical protein IKS23_03175 [Alphaproteobacteria bacterium]|nr:hypothetical protein [Alphaproteobacteria bacterium]